MKHEIPTWVRQKAEHRGDLGATWLRALPDIIEELESRWSVVAGTPFIGGTEGYVAPATGSDGTEAVIKITIPDPGLQKKVDVLVAADGRGYVKLLDYNVLLGGMLQERLGASLLDEGITPERQIEILCATLAQAWRVTPKDPVTDSDAAFKAVQLGEMIQRLSRELSHGVSRRVIDHALEYAERRRTAADPTRCVVVHGDPHAGNALRVRSARHGAESGFVFVDPDAFAAEPEYDLGVVLRDWSVEILEGDAPAIAHRYCALLASESGFDEMTIWEWGFVERVSTGLYLLSFGAEELARPFLDTAELLVAD
jgi:streptomycin 6-kinase